MKDNQANVALTILLPLLASIMALSPLAIDLYLPAMPDIAVSLSTDMTAMQNTLSIYLVGYAAGLLFFGPLADKYPRRVLVILGLSGFLLTTIVLLFATSIEAFMSIRFFQAFISSAATVVVPGTIREKYGKNTAKGLSYVSMIMMLAPMIAPGIGSIFLVLHSWQLIFVSLAIYALLILVLVIKFLPNSSLEKTTKTLNFLGRYALVLSNKAIRLDLISSMMISVAFFAYITAIPFVYLTVFGLSEFWFSALFALNILALMTAHFINSKFVVKKGSRRMLRYGVVVAVLTSFALVMITLFQLSIGYVLMCILPLMGSISMVAVNSDALILQKFTHQSGTATAVIGVLRFGMGGLAGPILAVFYDGSAMPFSLLMFVAVMVVFLCQLPALLKKHI